MTAQQFYALVLAVVAIVILLAVGMEGNSED